MKILTFDEKNHEYKADGSPVVSVTTALGAVGAWPTFSEIPSDDRDYYMDRGNKVHKAIYYIIKFIKQMEADEVPVEMIGGVVKEYIEALDPVIRGYVKSFEKFRTDPATGLSIVSSEERVFSDLLSVAGTLDLWAAMKFIDGPDAFLGDFKCGVHYPEYGNQSAGYTILKFYPDVVSFDPGKLQEVLKGYLPRRFGIHLNKEGKPPKLVEHDNQDDYLVFVDAIRKYHNLKREGKL